MFRFFFFFVKSSVLGSKENFYQRHTQETAVKDGLPPAQVSGLAGIATLT